MVNMKPVMAAMALVMAGAAHANLNMVRNGSFEDGLAVPSNVGYTTYAAGGTGLNDWTIYSGTVDVVSGDFVGLGAAQAGTRFLDLNGNTPGGISQDMTLTANQQYRLSFSYALNGDLTGLRAAVVVSPISSALNSSLIEFDSVPSQEPDIGWRTYNSTFVTSSTNIVKLRFQAIDGTNQGVLLDNISVTAVPEPGTFAMLLAGIGALGFVARRRKTH